MKINLKTILILIFAAMAIISCKTIDVEKAQNSLEIVQEDGQTKFILSKLQFEPNSAEITPDIANTLDYLKTILKSYDGESVLITGHAANIGDKSAIDAISLKRATTVADYLVDNKTFENENITIVGRGASEPIGNDDKAEENRRVEISIQGYEM